MKSQSAFVRGFIDDRRLAGLSYHGSDSSQSAFVRGFIDDRPTFSAPTGGRSSLNPRSCAASSMTRDRGESLRPPDRVSIRVRARLHR